MHRNELYTRRRDRWLLGALAVTISLLLASSFRAPEAMEGLQSTVALLKMLIRLTVLGVLGCLLLQHFQQEFPARNVAWYLPFTLLLIWGLCSVLWSARRGESLGQVISLSSLIMMSLSASLVIRGEIELQRILRWTIYNLVLICFFLLVTGLLLPSTGHMTRSGMGLGHSTNSGATASLGLLLLVLCGLLWNWRWVKFLMVPGCLIFLAVAICSGNRLSLGLSAIILPSMVIGFGGRRWIGWSVLAVALLGSLYPIIDSRFEALGKATESLNRGQSLEEISSLSGRQIMWEAMWKSFCESPWIGHGYFMSSAAGELEVWYLHGEMESVNWTAHNLWLQAMVSTGVVGLVLLLLAIGLPLGTLVCRRLAGHRWMKVDSWFSILFVWYFLWGLLNESILGPLQPESVIFFLMYGVLVARLTGRFKVAQAPNQTIVTARASIRTRRTAEATR